TGVDSPQSRKNDFQSLTAALQSGNLQAAQQAFNLLTQNGSSSGQSKNGTLSQDFQAIGKALQDGDVSGAQKALSSFQDALKTAMQGHHGHHHHHKAESASPASSTDSTDNSFGGVVKNVISTAVNLLA